MQDLGVVDQIGMRKHRAFRPAGGAGGVDNHRDVVGLAMDDMRQWRGVQRACPQTFGVVVAHGEDNGVMLTSDCLDSIPVSRSADHNAGLRVLYEIADFT